MIGNNCIFDLSTEGLEPLKHRIIGITTKTETEEQIFTDRDEKKMLEDFWNYVESCSFDKLIGFNSSAFDVPMLIVRSIKHKITIPNLNDRLVDLRKLIFGDEERRKGTLEDFRELLGINFSNCNYRNMHMSLLWEQRYEFTKLKEFLLRDVVITWQLYKHIEEAGLI